VADINQRAATDRTHGQSRSTVGGTAPSFGCRFCWIDFPGHRCSRPFIAGDPRRWCGRILVTSRIGVQADAPVIGRKDGANTNKKALPELLRQGFRPRFIRSRLMPHR